MEWWENFVFGTLDFRIGGYHWMMWLRKKFPFMRPRSEFRNGETVYGYDEYTVIDRRIDHCGQILVATYEGPLWIDPEKLDRDPLHANY